MKINEVIVEAGLMTKIGKAAAGIAKGVGLISSEDYMKLAGNTKALNLLAHGAQILYKRRIDTIVKKIHERNIDIHNPRTAEKLHEAIKKTLSYVARDVLRIDPSDEKYYDALEDIIDVTMHDPENVMDHKVTKAFRSIIDITSKDRSMISSRPRGELVNVAGITSKDARTGDEVLIIKTKNDQLRQFKRNEFEDYFEPVSLTRQEKKSIWRDIEYGNIKLRSISVMQLPGDKIEIANGEGLGL